MPCCLRQLVNAVNAALRGPDAPDAGSSVVVVGGALALLEPPQPAASSASGTITTTQHGERAPYPLAPPPIEIAAAV